MGWETRGRGGRYYTRGREVGGLAGELAATWDGRQRDEREAAAMAARAERRRSAAADAPLSRLCELADLAARVALLAAGYYRRHRGGMAKGRPYRFTLTTPALCSAPGAVQGSARL